MNPLEERIRSLAMTPVLLVASDLREAHDGPRAVEALNELSRLPHTFAAVLSGRATDDGAPRPRSSGRLLRPEGDGPPVKALEAARHRAGANAVLFLGDSGADQDVYGALGTSDVGINVGEGSTKAQHRVGSGAEALRVLEFLVTLRREWIGGHTLTPIERHSILSDQRTLAVTDPKARIVWLCLPRADSSAIFADLVGGPTRGLFDVHPAEHAGRPVQRYVGDSFVLETRWNSVTVTDYLDCGGGRPYQRPGRTDLVRVVQRTGERPVRVALRFVPRLDFGRISTRLIAHESGLEVEGSPDPIVLVAPGVRWTLTEDGHHQSAHAEVELGEAPLVLELRYGSANMKPSTTPEPERRKTTERFWSGWAGTLRLPKVEPDMVRRSALVLKALCHGPTGAILAAATTSLPEQLGGVRNWDYRYCWPRDASLSAAALIRLGNTGTAMKLIDWLIGVVFGTQTPDRLRPIYDVTGRELGTEAEIGDLPGYGHSRPVRIGNAAAVQVQLDVFGPIVDMVAMLAERGAPITPESWRLVEAMVGAVSERWTEPDHGIWEVRGPRQHHVYTKVMCWHAVDRALVVCESVLGRSRPAWEQVRKDIAEDVLTHGWNEKRGAFTGVYGGDSLDAAALAVGLTGLVKPDDERFVKTVEATERELRSGATVYRYREDDGLPGVEGGLFICAFWLVEALAMIGRRADAEELFEAACGLAGPTGMLSEEYEPEIGMALGNVPQAYSHLAFINAAVRLSGGEA